MNTKGIFTFLKLNKRWISCMLVLLILFLSLYEGTHALEEPPVLKASSSILVECHRGQILYQHEIEKRLHISSASKIMTALIAIEKEKLDSKVTISKESTSQGGSILNLEVGGKYDMEDLLYAIILHSANDAATAIAEYIGEDTNTFVQLMNKKALELNMKNTFFTNPTGLYNESQYTTAYDLSVLVRYALSNSTFNKIFASRAKPWFGKTMTVYLTNKNKLFWDYDDIDGGTAGYNFEDQQTAITTATRDNMRLLAIVLHSPEDEVFHDAAKLLDYGFENFKKGTLVSAGEPLKTIQIGNQTIDLVSASDFYYTFPKGDNYIESVEFNIPQNLKLPITKNRILGNARYILKDTTVIEVNLFAEEEVFPASNFLLLGYKKLSENKDIFILVVLLLCIEVLLMIYHSIRFVKRKVFINKKWS